jgi:hypothetical protein
METLYKAREACVTGRELISREQLPYGNQSRYRLTLKEGLDGSECAKRLNLASRYSFPRFHWDGTNVIEQDYYSIGD